MAKKKQWYHSPFAALAAGAAVATGLAYVAKNGPLKVGALQGEALDVDSDELRQDALDAAAAYDKAVEAFRARRVASSVVQKAGSRSARARAEYRAADPERFAEDFGA